MRPRRLEVDGVPIRWLESGDGPPVVLMHGIPTGPALWRHVVPRVNGARCLALEMVGYGASISDGEGRDISVARQASHLLSWLDALSIDRAVLVGHDLGGGVAQIAAVRAPERCAGLVLTNSIAYDSWPIPSVKVLRALAPGLRHLPAATVYPMVATLFVRGHDDLGVARESLALHWSNYARRGGAAALARQVRSLDVRDTLAIADRIGDVDVPARLVWGAAEPLPAGGVRGAVGRGLDAELWRIEGGRHFLPEDHPRDVAAAIERIIEEV